MSEQHTPAPWFVKSAPDNDMIGCNAVGLRSIVYCLTADGTISNEEREANARRIVACVNACAGFTTIELESGFEGMNLYAACMDAVERKLRTQKENDALQARVKELEALLTPLSEYLKEHETPVECIIRNRKDVDYTLTELVNKMRETESANAKVKELEAQRDELLNAMQSISEYWNQSTNDQAMIDALWHNIETANEAIAKIEAERKA